MDTSPNLQADRPILRHETSMYVVEGKLSEYYNLFEDYDFGSCEATDTRLMGVVAMRVTWTGKEDPRNKLYQVIHLDFSEYGVDDYFEFECIPGEESYRENREGMKYRWNSFLNVMGGKVVMISCRAMIRLIDTAIPLADNNRRREYDNEENAAFRKYALLRFSLMRSALDNRGAANELPDEQEIIEMLVPDKLATCETINYFIMRIVDLDFAAASYLSTIPAEELRESLLTHPGIQTLMKNSIRQSKSPEDIPADGSSVPYRCKATTLAENGYYYTSYVIYLDGDYRQKNSKVTQLDVGSMNKLSDYEAAVQVKTTEYITVFDCRDRILNNFDGSKFEFLNGAEPQQVKNGWLYTIYNRDNSHVNRSDYWLNDDVYGYAILTIDGEFILMSNKLMNINYMDQCAVTSLYAPFMTLEGRYQMSDPIFHALCNTYGVMFRDFVDHIEDY